MNKRMKPVTPEDIFNDFKHYIGCNDSDGKQITADALMAWAKRPNQKFVCVFCGDDAVDRGGFVYCQRCREYKGIVPNVFLVE